MSRPALLLFTDLDGTLLDHDYLPGPAAPALERLRRVGVEVIACSSKTRAEQRPLRRELGITGPYVVENGGAIVVPRATARELRLEGGEELTDDELRFIAGAPAEQIRSRLREARSALGLEFVMYAEMRPAELAELASLSLPGARRAMEREHSETIVGLRAGEVEALAAVLSPELRVVSGGRFHTVSGSRADKGEALRWLAASFRRCFRGLETVAVGDGPNDEPMLAAADRPFVVARPDGSHGALPGTRLAGVGPSGWAELADILLSELSGRGR